jgi:hypothetical protein
MMAHNLLLKAFGTLSLNMQGKSMQLLSKKITSKINLMSLFISLTRKLNLRLRKPFREIDFYSVNPDTGTRNFLTIDDLEHIAPSVKDYTDKQPVLTIKEIFPLLLILS